VLTWGRGEDGQLGHGTTSGHAKPEVVDALRGKGVTHVVCGAEFTVVFSKGKDQIWSWGWGDFGRLGHGDPEDIFIPKQIRCFIGIPIKIVACGDAHTMVVSQSGDLYSFGRNQNGQLGLGSTIDSLIPQKLTSLPEDEPVTSVSCGAEHTVVCTHAGGVYSWGWGKYGNLGHGNMEDLTSPKHVTGLSGVKVVQVACGWRHSCAISDKGELFTFGWSKYGQLGHGDNGTCPSPKRVEALSGFRVIMASGGWRHMLALVDARKEDSSQNGGARIYGWGWNQYGQVGNASDEDANSPQLVNILNKSEETPAGFSFVSCGWRHSLAIDCNGNYYLWGRGVHGQLGHGDCQDSSVPKRLENINLISLGKIADIPSGHTKEADARVRAEVCSERFAVVPERENPSSLPGQEDGQMKKQKL